MENFDVRNKENEFKRINSRLLHVVGRGKRIRVQDHTNGDKSNVLARSLQLIDRLQTIYRLEPEESLLDHPEPRDRKVSLLDDPILLLPELLLPNSRTKRNSQASTCTLPGNLPTSACAERPTLGDPGFDLPTSRRTHPDEGKQVDSGIQRVPRSDVYPCVGSAWNPIRHHHIIMLTLVNIIFHNLVVVLVLVLNNG